MIVHPDAELLHECEDIARTWASIRGCGFPRGFGGKVIDGIELVMLDVDTAMCIDAFVKNRSLKPLTHKAIVMCVEDIRIVIPQLDSAASQFFVELETVASRVINYLEQAKERGLVQ